MSAYLPYRTKVFIGINVRDIRNCQNREIFKPTKIISQQVLVAPRGGALSGKVPTRLISKTKTNPLKAL